MILNSSTVTSSVPYATVLCDVNIPLDVQPQRVSYSLDKQINQWVLNVFQVSLLQFITYSYSVSAVHFLNVANIHLVYGLSSLPSCEAD